MDDIKITVETKRDGLDIDPPNVIFRCIVGNPAEINNQVFSIGIDVSDLNEDKREQRLKYAAIELLIQMYQEEVVHKMLHALVTSALKGENPLK